MAGSPPNFHKMDSRSACIQGVLKIKVKVKGHVIRALSWILEMSCSVIDGLVFASAHMFAFCASSQQFIVSCAALYGTLFGSESEAAFSNYRLWESLGFFVSFAYSFYLCAAVKLYILTALLILAMLGYFAAEYLHWKTSVSTPDGRVTTDVTAASSAPETECEKLVVCPRVFSA